MRAARRRLDPGAAGVQWRSTAAERFRDDVAEHAARLDRCADELAEAATALRTHARAAEARAAALGVVDVSGGYSDRMVDTGAVDIDLTVAETVSPAEREDLLDRAEALVWRSGVEPLEVVNVVLGTPGSSELLGERLYQERTQLQERERRYGPGPG